MQKICWNVLSTRETSSLQWEDYNVEGSSSWRKAQDVSLLVFWKEIFTKKLSRRLTFFAAKLSTAASLSANKFAFTARHGRACLDRSNRDFTRDYCSPFTLGNFLKTWPPAMTRLSRWRTKRRTICIDANYATVYPRQPGNCFATTHHTRGIDNNFRDNEFSEILVRILSSNFTRVRRIKTR